MRRRLTWLPCAPRTLPTLLESNLAVCRKNLWKSLIGIFPRTFLPLAPPPRRSPAECRSSLTTAPTGRQMSRTLPDLDTWQVAAISNLHYVSTTKDIPEMIYLYDSDFLADGFPACGSCRTFLAWTVLLLAQLHQPHHSNSIDQSCWPSDSMHSAVVINTQSCHKNHER